MKKTAKILAFVLSMLLLTAAFASCASKGETLMTYKDKTMSVNTFELLLSRMKGTLEDYGYNVSSDSLWKTVLSSDGTTYDDYFRISVLEQASRYLIAEELFDSNGLTLTEEREDLVETIMAKFVEQAGSKTNLNSQLKQYGANYDILRELYILETKIDMLKDHLYGENGEKVSEEDKESFLSNNYVAFGQIFIAGYYELIDTDKFGDTVYYTDDKHTAIAYDKSNGVTKIDEFGKIETDILGNPVYYNAEGKIAYDKANGVIGYLKDSSGDIMIEYFDEEKLSEFEERAQNYAEACDGDRAAFLEYATLYDESEATGKTMYLRSDAGYYSLVSESVSYLDDITKTLTKMEVGECAVVQSDYGFHVICKFEAEKGIYDSEEEDDVFADFYDNLVAFLFEEECKKYEEEVEIDQDVLDTAPSMAEVVSNRLY